MTSIAITVNTRAVNASVEPRTHLADFLRDHLDLTGTHLGCEHGVCGACTLLIDDMPARSCITLATACDGARITTIEGLDHDEIAAELRAAFTREHGLQCGYCTPGMLISARDLVLRLETADEGVIRVALAGNLCRCTGYVGIVRAVRSVIEGRRGRGITAMPGAGRTLLGPVGSADGACRERQQAARPLARTEIQERPATTIPEFSPDKVVAERFAVSAPPDKVFALFGDIRRVAACLPGVALTGEPTPEQVEGLIRLRLGPVSASFRGIARVERDPETMSGRIVGAGNDQRNRSSSQGEIRYHLFPIEQGAITRVELSIGYSLQGMLAQIAREGLVRNLIGRVMADFARNLDRQLAGGADCGLADKDKSLDGIALVLDLLRARVREIVGKVWNR